MCIFPRIQSPGQDASPHRKNCIYRLFLIPILVIPFGCFVIFNFYIVRINSLISAFAGISTATGIFSPFLKFNKQNYPVFAAAKNPTIQGKRTTNFYFFQIFYQQQSIFFVAISIFHNQQLLERHQNQYYVNALLPLQINYSNYAANIVD